MVPTRPSENGRFAVCPEGLLQRVHDLPQRGASLHRRDRRGHEVRTFITRDLYEIRQKPADSAAVALGLDPLQRHDLSSLRIRVDGVEGDRRRIPAFVGVLDKAVKRIIEVNAGEAIQRGDIFATNDPFYGGVTHLNDVVLAMPVSVSTYQDPASGSTTLATFVSSAMICWVRRASFIANSDGMA